MTFGMGNWCDGGNIPGGGSITLARLGGGGGGPVGSRLSGGGGTLSPTNELGGGISGGLIGCEVGACFRSCCCFN